MMITRFSLLLVVGLAGSLGAAETAALPEPFAPDRYAAMKQSSPFALATPAAEKAEANFARDMFISGIARIGEKNLVSITTQDKTKSYTLITGDPPIEGMALLDVNWNDQLGKTTVQIKKGEEFATLQFNEMVVRAPAAMTVVPSPQASRGARGAPGAQGGPAVPRVVNRNNAQGGEADRPRRRIIRRPSQ